MPRHIPILFKDPNISDEIRERTKKFVKDHPLASSAVQVLLATAIMGGTITVAAAFPGIFKLIGKHEVSEKKAKRERYQKLWRSFNNLKKKNIFEKVGEGNEGVIYRFSDKGRAMVREFAVETLELEKPKRWDGKWRMVMFDIPEKFKSRRLIFQRKLSELDFYQLQKSVWLHPFSCVKEINFLRDFLEIKPYVEIFELNEMSNGRALYYFRDLLKKHA
ncbi:hypothetical protein A2W70_01635 [Candidatus Curtissbacteria bacterium RIFCSPLOWO2_02_41_11]|uniref:Transcriptional repressor PaaX-like central Cas2-like domain-containing protein n=3 Tax=Patescibacteria group TaxID=1783273 RepID=A0A1F5HQC6_9BACT|nr:MAG: Repressor in the phenylacetic acid catabolism [Candidatus Giovannonibacteria bacterium GW2011_GWF2_42_19]OGE06354.1 MAG: hypothetical protein A2W70_01635 [Candidatus Curtissbacteria bacterium RIFCSPLOWO2_02_41_11]